ncbi:MAG: [citrate (pro-3S)-lyase] ligase [Synergistaceae bacterium]|nr:[citrate (pro-3S)-lyase] ligase [Synergistaceae bacterium]
MFGFDIELICNLSSGEEKRLRKFLDDHGLSFEGKPDITVLVKDPAGRLIATGSLQGEVIRMVAVDPSWQEAGLSGIVISRLVEFARERGMTRLFVYTKPESADRFAALGFRELARVEGSVVLLEMGEPGVDAYRAYLEENRAVGGKNGAVVVNCNPFTLGHRFLIERAASSCDRLFIIVVEADLSLFPFKDRYALVREGTSDLANVTVLKSGAYAVSPATFPTYFLRDKGSEETAAIQAKLDVTLFANLFVPALDLRVRFVGTEPYCEVTGAYNEAMKSILPARGVELFEIPRYALDDGTIVSASTVRERIRCSDWAGVRRLVPDVTWNYLNSSGAAEIISRIQSSRTRH